MVIVFIVLVLAVVTFIGKMVNSRQNGLSQGRTKFLGMRSPESTFDREENPRHDDDGTSFGYRPGD